MNLLIAAVIGLALGPLYVALLGWSVRRALAEPRWAPMFAAGQLARLALFALVFVALARTGLAAGLAMLAGFWVARWYLIARLGGVRYGR